MLDVYRNKKSRRWLNSFDIALASESSGVKTKKPQTVHLENLSYPIVDKNGNLQYAVIQHHNITEIVKTDQALKDSEETYRNIFVNSQIGLFRSELETGNITDVNDALARIVGFNNREELLEEGWTIANQYVEPKRRIELINKLVKYGSFQNEESLFVDKTGTREIWLRMSATITQSGILEGVAEDVTQKVKTDKNLEKQRKITEEYIALAKRNRREMDFKRSNRRAQSGNSTERGASPSFDEGIRRLLQRRSLPLIPGSGFAFGQNRSNEAFRNRESCLFAKTRRPAASL